MNKLTTLLDFLNSLWLETEPFAISAMPYVGLIIALVHGKTILDYVQTIEGVARKRFWLKRAGIRIALMVVIIFRVHGPFGLQLGMGPAFLLILAILTFEMRMDTRYLVKNYISSFFFKSSGHSKSEAEPFDIVAFLALLRTELTISVGNLKIDLLPDRPGVVARVRFTFLEDGDFPYQWHIFVEMTKCISGIVRVNGKLVDWDTWVRIEENQVHNVSGSKGSIAESEFFELELLPATNLV